MRTIIITNKEIFDGLKEKDKLVDEGRKISVKIESLEAERNTKAMQVQKVKDRVIPLIEEEIKKQELGEFEAVGDVVPGKILNDVEIEVFDQVEQYKEYILEKKKEDALKEMADANSSDNTPDESADVEEPAPDSEGDAVPDNTESGQ